VEGRRGFVLGWVESIMAAAKYIHIVLGYCD